MKTLFKTCPKCGTEFNAYREWGETNFCSIACSHSRTHDEEARARISRTLTGRKGPPSPLKGKQRAIRLTRECECCKKTFLTTEARNKKYCSNACAKKMAGGYRNGSGRSKTGYYKGIYCGSTYELCWVIHALDHGIKFSRFDGCVEKDGIKYYPDFLLEDGKTIIELKGYEHSDSVDAKTKVAEFYGYKVQVLRKINLMAEFEWIKNNYSCKNVYELYDDYKPKYEYVCNHCGVSFSRDKKIKTDAKFCSRECSGKNQSGTKFITDGFTTMKIKNTDEIRDGWVQGRAPQQVKKK